MTDRSPYLGPRTKLLLGKYPVLRVIDRGFGIKQFSLRINDVTLVVPAPSSVDVHEGDLLSLYTEVPIAIPQSTPKQ